MARVSNLYLHWFDKLIHRDDGPVGWAGRRLVRCADDFVLLARYPGTRLKGWIESKLEGWLWLEINRVARSTGSGQSLCRGGKV
jgi:RNA-directed DNA polymerase